MRNILDYGAVGDGVTLNTSAIQAAVNDGGMVLIPPGKFVTGTIYLESDGGLYLAPGATLVASHDFRDYNKMNFCPQNWGSVSELHNGEHLIAAVGKKNVTIEGHGTIDGQGRHWMNESRTRPGWPFPENRDYDPVQHPAQMIYFCECENVHVTDVTLTNSPYWHLFFHGCADVFARGLKISGDRPHWTNDGIDIDSCENVTVSDCVIDVGDDAIAIRGDGKRLIKRPNLCEKITITNCVLRAARDYGIRIGVGGGIIRNVVISNLDIEAPNCAGVGFMGRWHPQSKEATSVERVSLSNLNIRARRGIEMVAAEGDSPLPNPCFVRDISFSRIFVEEDIESKFAGNSEVALENIDLDDLRFFVKEGVSYPLGLMNFENVKAVTVSRMRITNRGVDTIEAVCSGENCEITLI